MYPGYKRVKNGGARADMDRRRSGGPYGPVVGRSCWGRATGAYRNDHIYRRIAGCNLFTKYAKVAQLTQQFVLKLASFQPGTMTWLNNTLLGSTPTLLYSRFPWSRQSAAEIAMWEVKRQCATTTASSMLCAAANLHLLVRAMYSLLQRNQLNFTTSMQ